MIILHSSCNHKAGIIKIKKEGVFNFTKAMTLLKIIIQNARLHSSWSVPVLDF